jgi:RNA polymerase sigma-70 factor, ECF subfamily
LIARRASRLVPEPGPAPVQGQRGTEQPVDELLASHAEAVYRYALRLTRDGPAAQDLAQETLLRGWQARGKLREPAAARIWLLRIATNLHRDNWRSRQPTEPLTRDPVDLRPCETERIDDSECVERALAALDELPPRQRQAMHLITIEQLTHKDAAEVLGITVDALKANLSLARRRMRERLKDVYEESRSVRTRAT